MGRQDQRDSIQLKLGSGIQMVFRWIPPGSFLMGAKGFNDDEEPIHRVRISKGFYFGTYPVTQEEFGVWTQTDEYEEWFREAQERGWLKERHENSFGGKGKQCYPAERITVLVQRKTPVSEIC